MNEGKQEHENSIAIKINILDASQIKEIFFCNVRYNLLPPTIVITYADRILAFVYGLMFDANIC